MSEIAPGWYKDPADPSTQRYWDGEGWLGTPLPADATPPDGPPPAEGPLPPAATGPASPASGFTPATNPAQVPASPPPASTPPQGWTPPPGSAPPQGWTPPPPGWTPPPGSLPPGWTPPGAPGAPGMHVVYGYEPQVRPHGFALAGLGPRLMARLLDIFAVLLLNIVVNGWFAYQWWQEIAPVMRAALQDPMGSPPEPTERSQYLLLTMLFIATALWLAYEVPAIGSTGQTPGKRIMHIRVVRVENLDPIGYGRAFSRWARLGMWTTLWWCYGIGLLFQLIDSASVLFDKKMRQALHDKTAHTVVVDAPPPAKHTTSPGDGIRSGGDGRRDADPRGGSTAGNGVPDDGPDPTGGAR